MSSLYSYPSNDYRNYLKHYGVVGMHWGVRRYQNSDGSYTAAGKVRYSKNQNTYKERYDDGPADLAILAAITLSPYVLALSIAGVSAADEAWNKHLTNKKIKNILKQRIGEIDEKTGLRKRTDDKPIEEDLKNVNPTLNGKDPRTYNNCVLCSMAVETRRRGYDVMAKLSADGFNGALETQKAFPKTKFKVIDPDNLFKERKTPDQPIVWSDENHDKVKSRMMNALYGYNSDFSKGVINKLSKEKNSRGSMFVQWGYGGGHAISYEVKNGKVRLIDGQVNKIYEGDSAEKFLARTWYAASVRLDKAEMNSSAIKDYVM